MTRTVTATQWIIMFAKAPQPGLVKTRLARSIGDEAAAKMHEAFILDMAHTMELFRQGQPSPRDIQLCLAWSGQEDHPCFERLRQMGFVFIAQPTGDLGARLKQVSVHAFEQGARRVVITGSDSPTLLERHYRMGFELLSESDSTVVFGPSFDGGYYLVGLNTPTTSAFDDIPWSREDTLEVSIRRVREQQGQRCRLIDFWYDVDTLDDLNHLRRHLRYLNELKVLKGSFAHTNAQLTILGQEDKKG